jgi:AcrR family transcriptional regulator
MKPPTTPSGNPPRRRRRSAEIARKEILDAAQKRLSEGGPEAIRLQEIARDVGIAHPTIIHHFGSRDGLIRALDARAVEALTRDVVAVLKRGESPTAEVELIERVAETMEEQGLARLIAWWALREPGADPAQGIDPPSLVENISKLIAARVGDEPGLVAREHETVSFAVRLAVIATFGDALLGDLLSPAEEPEREAERRRFRAWMARLLREGLTAPEDPSAS